MASHVAVKGDGSHLRSFRSSSSTPERQGHSPPDEIREHQILPQRGTIQKLKKGVAEGLLRGRRLSSVASMEQRSVVVEICAGVGNLTKVANYENVKKWKALEPIENVYGHDLLKKVDASM